MQGTLETRPEQSTASGSPSLLQTYLNLLPGKFYPPWPGIDEYTKTYLPHTPNVAPKNIISELRVLKIQ
jgi:hypothetical protein